MNVMTVGLVAVLAVLVLLYVGRRRGRVAGEDHD
jgi:hypothetical protein